MPGLVSVVLPAHDEAETIADVVKRCVAETPDLAEVIVVDDGSADSTAQVASLAGAHVHRLPRNEGKGVALRTGVRLAKGDVVVVLDADGQDDPGDIPRLLDALAPGVDMVIGSRFLGQFEPGAIAPIDWVGNRVLTSVLNLLYGVDFTDSQAGFRVVRRAAFQRADLSARGYDIESDMLAAILLGGGEVVEVPVRRRRRAHGASDLRQVRDGVRILARIVGRRLRSPGNGRR